MHQFYLLTIVAGLLLSALVRGSPIRSDVLGPSTIQRRDLAQRGNTALSLSKRADYIIIPIPEADPAPSVSIKATTADFMSVIVCTDSPVYYGNCQTIQLETQSCVDFTTGPWENSISSIKVETMNTLCMLWQDHECTGSGPSMYLNLGDTSRDLVSLTPYNDKISSIACYWDLRGVTGTWNAY